MTSNRQTVRGARMSLLAAVGAWIAVCGGPVGCDQQAPPPAAPAGGGSGGNAPAGGGGGSDGGGRLSNMSENPTSMLGRSAQQGKSAARQMSQEQSRTLGAAQELTGEATAVEAAGLSWSVPSGWEKVKAVPPRVAEYQVPGDEGVGTVAFFFFPGGQGGNVTQNLERWKAMVVNNNGQPEEQTVTRRTVMGMAVTFAAADGTYLEGMPGQQKSQRPGYAFRGAIIEGPQGNVFVRLTGPKAVVAGAEGAWREMIEGTTKK